MRFQLDRDDPVELRGDGARTRATAGLGFTGLHGTVFVHEAAGLVVFVTLTAAGTGTS